MKINYPFGQILKGSLALAVIACLGTPQARAASSAWAVDGNGTWATGSNWTAGSPGATGDTANADIATFGFTLTAARTVTADANRGIGGITFNGTAAFGYAVTGTGSSLLLKNGGTILSNATTGSRTDAVNSNIIIEGVGGSAAFTNNSTASSGILSIGQTSTVTGVSTSGSTTTLNLSGTNTLSNQITAAIANGSAGGNLAVVKSDAGKWRLRGANAYSGGTTLNAGTLAFDSQATVFGNGTLTINAGTLEHQQTTAAVSIGNAIVVGGNFSFLEGAVSANATTFTGTVNLGGATRTITASGVAGSNFNISGVISNGGLTKSGAGTMTLQGINTYTDDTTITTGTLVLAANAGLKFAIGGNGVNTKLAGATTVILDGNFTFDLSGAGTTLGNSWNIVNVATLTETFGTTFGVNTFSRQGGGTGAGIWQGSANSTTYQFDTSLGTLTVVPEPSTWGLLAFSLTTVMILRRRRARD